MPEGLAQAKIAPKTASWSSELGEYLMKYEEFRRERSPDDALMQFLTSSYAAAADAGKWDRAALER